MEPGPLGELLLALAVRADAEDVGARAVGRSDAERDPAVVMPGVARGDGRKRQPGQGAAIPIDSRSERVRRIRASRVAAADRVGDGTSRLAS